MTRNRGLSPVSSVADGCGELFRGGVVLHAGNASIKLAADNCLTVPLARLWDQ